MVLSSILHWAVVSSLRASILAVLVLAMVAVARARLQPTWAYALWLLVFAALALPWAPSSTISMYRWLAPPVAASPLATATRNAITTVGGQLPAAQATVSSPSGTPTSTGPAATDATLSGGAAAPSPPLFGDPLRRAIVGFWLAGIVLFSLRTLASEWRFRLRLRKARPVDDPSVLDLGQACARLAGVRRPPAVWDLPGLPAPVLFGVLRPRIVLPAGLADQLSRAELRHVLLHEILHQRRADLAVNWLAATLATLHWFNPLVWVSARQLADAQELACDAAVLARLEPGQNVEYGRTLIRVLELAQAPVPALPSAAGVLRGRSLSRRRVGLIRVFRTRRSRWAGVVGAILLSGVAVVGLTRAGAVRTGAPPTSAAPPAAARPEGVAPSPAGGATRGTTVAAATGAQAALDSIAFVADSTGWVGGQGLILSTTDGGGTWKTQYSGPADIKQLDFVNPQDGWARTATGLLFTVDGGRTWADASTEVFTSLQFVSPEVGFALSPSGGLYRTADAGKIWTPVRTPVAVGSFCFSGATLGFLATPGSRPAALYRTDDGGGAWAPFAEPAPTGGNGSSYQNLRCSGSTLFDLVTPVGGGYAGGEAYALFSTSPTRAAWTGLAANQYPLGALPQGPGFQPGGLAVRANTAYLIGVCGGCAPGGATYMGTNLGTSWRNAQVGGLPFTQAQVSFPTRDNGWMVASWSVRSAQTLHTDSAVLETTSGGTSWTQRYPVPQSPTPG